jgi:phosphohistidine phosphatase
VADRAPGPLIGGARTHKMIYLMRHADAVSDEVNPVRPLSQRGRDQVARVCAALRKNADFRPGEIMHSSLERSRETAELLAQGLKLIAPLVPTRGIEPDDDPGRIAAVLESSKGDVAIVGHEPHLGVLASLMVHGPERSGVFFPFPKAAMLALTRDGKRWRSEWLVRSP